MRGYLRGYYIGIVLMNNEDNAFNPFLYIFAANLDTLQYPLLFTDNDKANPRFFARTRLQGARRLSFHTLRDICQNTKIEEEQWIKNDLGEQYNPCPTELMKEYTCPIDGCSEDKCAIHWTLCN